MTVGEQIINAIVDIALIEFKTDERYLDDFHISLRELKQIVWKIENNGSSK